MIVRKGAVVLHNHSMTGKSRLVTFIIYSLLLYIVISMIKPVIPNLAAEDDIYQYMKKMILHGVPSAEYVHKVNTGFDSEADIMGGMVKDMLNTPFSSYIEQTVAVNVAQRPEYYFLGDSELTNEEAVQDMASAGKHTGNELTGNPESNPAGDSQPESTADSNPAEPATSGEEVPQETGEPQPPETQSPGTQSAGNHVTLPAKVKEIDTNLLTFDFLMANYYTVVSSTTITPEDLNAQSLMAVDLKMQQDNSQPQILIYHTHGMEAFADSNPEDRNTGIVGVGNYLTQLLTEQYGYNVIHIEDSFDYVNGVLDRSKAYDYAYNRISQILADYPSIEVVLDIHRDGVNENNHLVTTVNGKPTAKIMFFNGISRLNGVGEIDYLYNPYRSQNLAMSLQMKVLAEEYFEGFTRRNYIQAYQYNLHLRPKSMLIEVGAQTNTFEEVKNAMEPLAALLYMELQ